MAAAGTYSVGKERTDNMWNYEKKLQYPINIKTPNPKLAQMIISQYGGAYTKRYGITLNKFRLSNQSG